MNENLNRDDGTKLGKVGELVNLGGTEYLVSPKSIKHSRGWKLKAKPVLLKLEDVFKQISKAQSNVESVDISVLYKTILDFCLETFDELVDLVFEWESGWDKEAVLNTASEDEIITCFFYVLNFAFPFIKQLGINPANLSQNIKKNMQNQ
jgi:hypothetical protein